MVGSEGLEPPKFLTYQDVLLQLLHTLLDTEYNTPHVFCLAGYSTILHGSGASVLLLRLYCYLAFPCEVRLNNHTLTFSIRQFGCTS